jgi:large conductance mechanosensitive channel
VIGGAFGKIVTSMVSDIIMPVVGVLTGGVNFTDHKLVIRQAVEEIPNLQKAMPQVTLNWGNFVQAGVDFIIVALCIFVVVKMNTYGTFSLLL